MRGDDPHGLVAPFYLGVRVPRMRGDDPMAATIERDESLGEFPACAGMIRTADSDGHTSV